MNPEVGAGNRRRRHRGLPLARLQPRQVFRSARGALGDSSRTGIPACVGRGPQHPIGAGERAGTGRSWPRREVMEGT